MLFARKLPVTEKRGIDDEREALSAALTKWEKEGLRDKKFCSGLDVPDMGDIAVYGVLQSVEGLPAHEEAILQRGGAIGSWYQRMRNEAAF